MDQGPVVVGIDIAASRPCVAVAVRCGRALEVEAWRESDEHVAGDRARLIEWLQGLGAVAVGVDAPQRPRRAQASGVSRPRACDADLAHRRISIYQVPTRAVAAQADGLYAWMETGWDYFRELGRRGFEPPAPGLSLRRSARLRRRSRSIRTRRSRRYSAARRRPRAAARACACGSPRFGLPGSSGTSTTTTTRWTRSPRRSRRGASCRGSPRRSATSVTGHLAAGHRARGAAGTARLTEREALTAARRLGRLTDGPRAPPRVAALHDDLVERILDDALGAGLLEARDDLAHHALLEDRVDGHPAAVAERRDRGLAQRGQHGEHGVEVAVRTFSISPTRPCASMAPAAAGRCSRSCAASPVLQAVAVGDELRVLSSTVR